ncbi:MAG TPA: hypothetical protein VK082_07550 [Paenalcaligenes sp.]|nr:hypothetical protein [Paenalcaligenes sp.]
MSNDKPASSTEVLIGSLFPAKHAQSLWPAIQEHAPNLCQWLASSRGQSVAHDPLRQRCSAHEHFQLQDAGFQTQSSHPLGAGMALILALQQGFWQQIKEKNNFWLAELIHLAPGREGASLIPARLLDITAQESAALLESLDDYIADTPFEFTPLSPTHWSVDCTETLPSQTATVELAFETTVQDWWDTSTQGRTWRQWANEIQMIWFQHPVNIKRQQQGRPVINGLWLMGGAAPGQLARPNTPSPHINRCLEQSFREQDWGEWLHQLAKLDSRWQEQPPQKLVFTGNQGYVVCDTPAHRTWLQRIFTQQKTGQTCWLNPH